MTSDMIAERPLPEITELTEPFWTAAKARRLEIQRCDDCGAYRFPPEYGCAACSSMNYTWTEVSGRAELYTWTAVYPPLLPYFAERAPWPLAFVQLEEGPRMATNLPGIDLSDYEIGMALQADFEDINEEITLVVFKRR
jgi:uncharacterized OB-fold protein